MYNISFTPNDLEAQINGTGDIYRLEKKLAGFYGKKYCILTSNATMALFLAGLAMELQDSHIITSPFGWPGTLGPFVYLENTFSFTDLDDHLCMDYSSIKNLITSRTKAIISQDTGGYAADSKAIAREARKYGLKYISDSSQSMGAFRDGKPAGYYADAIIVSFSAGKLLSAGEGGAIITDDEKIYEKIILLSQHPHRQKKVFGISGYNPFTPFNARMHPLSAKWILRNWKKYPYYVEERREKVKTILAQLKDSNCINKPDISINASSFFKLFIKIKPNCIHRLANSSFKWTNDFSDLNIYEQALNKLTDHLINTSEFEKTINEKLKKYIEIIL